MKDQINLDEPETSGTPIATLLRAAVDDTLDFERRWAAYAASEKEPLVVPVLVVQVDDKPTDTELRNLVAIIEDEWRNLGPHAIVNVFGEHEDLVIGARKVRWVPPESIQDEAGVRVVLAKHAISTGWDCPRAEVLFSERAAKDATHIAQVIGRMVRSPLARRITTDDALNSVSCFLPRFDREALTEITRELTKPGEPGGAAEVTVGAQLFPRNGALGDDVFECVESLPSLPPPNALANPLRRAKALAQLLTDDAVPNGALRPEAGEHLAQTLNAKLDGLAAQHAAAVRANVSQIENTTVRRTTITTAGETLGSTTRPEETASRDVERDTRKLIDAVKEGVARDYVRYRVGVAGEHADLLAIRTEVAGLLMVEGVVDELEATATEWVLDQFARFGAEIKHTTGATHDAYMKVKEQTSKPEETAVELTTTLKAPTKDSNKKDAKDLERFGGHLFADEHGKFPAKLNGLETKVLNTELQRRPFVAWYRNPQRATQSSLRVAYVDDSGQWGSLQVDFLIVSRRDDGTLGVSIVDPHGDYLADARTKLRGLADYAERFEDRYVRIESIAEATDGRLRYLDLLDPRVRAAVHAFQGAKITALYESEIATDYK